MIFDSCTFAWQTGQLTIRAADEGEEAGSEAVEAAGGFILSVGSLLVVFWKKSKMEASELLCTSHPLFRDTLPLLE